MDTQWMPGLADQFEMLREPCLALQDIVVNPQLEVRAPFLDPECSPKFLQHPL